MDLIIGLLIIGLFGYVFFSIHKDSSQNSEAWIRKVVIVGTPREPTNEGIIQGGISMPKPETEAVMSLVDSISQLLDEIGVPVPKIESPQQVFSSMSQDLRTKVAPFIYPPFGEGAGNLVNMRLEAVTKAAEIHYRLSLYKEQSLTSHGKMAILANVAPENLRVLLGGVAGMQKAHKEISAQLEGPFEKLGEHVVGAVFYDYTQKLLEGLDKDKTNHALLDMVKTISFLPSSIDENEQVIKVKGEPVDEVIDDFIPQRKNGNG